MKKAKKQKPVSFSYFIPKSILNADEKLLEVLQSRNGITITPLRSYIYYKLVTVKYTPQNGDCEILKAKLIPNSLWTGNRDLLILPGKFVGVFNAPNGSWIPTGITEDFTVLLYDDKRRKNVCGSLQIV